MHDPARVLIVEDDAQITQAMGVRLRAQGYDVLSADSAEKGLDLVSSKEPDLVVMDIQLPNKDGLTALTEIHDQPRTRQTPVVIVSACSNEKAHALELGASFFVDKPYAFSSLLAAIRRSLGQAPPAEHSD